MPMDHSKMDMPMDHSKMPTAPSGHDDQAPPADTNPESAPGKPAKPDDAAATHHHGDTP
jgi:hypothetical protein